MMKKTNISVGIFTLAIALFAGIIWSPSAQAQEPYLGQIQMFGFNFAPRSWAFCNGQLLSISQNTALFSLLGTTFGGDGRTTFALPDLRGRVPVGVGTGPGLPAVRAGERGGAATVTLTVNNLPPHTHTATVRASSAQGNQQSPSGHVLGDDSRENQYSDAAPDVNMNTAMVTVGNTGAGQSFSIMQPYLGINFSIAVQGIYPSRN